MSDTVIREADLQPHYYPERLAWGILLISFALFSITCAVTTISVQWFFFQSTVSLRTNLQPGKATTTVWNPTGREDAVRDVQMLSTGDTFVGTDTTVERSQATVFFYDTAAGGERLVTMVTLKENTVLNLRNASRPRFSWGNRDYQIDLFDAQGEFEINIPDDLRRDIEVNIRTVQGLWVRLGDSGHYSVSSSPGQISVTNWDGEAVLIVPESNVQPRSIPVGQRGAITIGDSEIRLNIAPVNLLNNSELRVFTPENEQNTSSMNVDFPTGWGCGYEADDQDTPAPRGEHRANMSPDSRSAFQLVRYGATTTGRTGCTQNVGDGQNGYDVTEFDNLELRISLYIEHQSVGACGIVATECPLMIQINYVGSDGVERRRIHGIYAVRDQNVPPVCSECFQPHVLIHKNAWYIYESGNLFDLLRLPSSDGTDIVELEAIKSIRIYASGHEYEVFIDDVSLLAWNNINTTDLATVEGG